MLGSTIGDYKLLSELGTGGMGTVYLAEGPEERRAVKIVHPHLLESPGFFKRFMREGELGRKVIHENVVRTFDVDAIVHEGKHHHYLVMEYVEGKSLRDMLLEFGTIPEALLRQIALQTAAGLTAIHAHDIVHRDLKPENILITDAHEIRIMDLGVAKLQEASIAITKEGQFAGSLLYASPEQFRRDDEVGPRSDLYALGVVLYELATGINPFRADDAAAVIQAQLGEVPVKVHERNPDLSLFLSEVIATLLAKAPGDRIASAEELHTVLEEAERSAWWKEREPQLKRTEAALPRIHMSRETKLYGRDGDLARLRELFELASAGKGGTIFLEGEAGIGKTRLIDAFLKDIDDAHVLYGSYPPSGGLGGLSEAVLGKFGEADLEHAVAPYLTATPTLVPAFAALIKHAAPPTGTDPLGGEALQAVVVHLMRALAADKPTLWILDDMHFAPQDSRDVLLAMARAVADHRVLVLATARPGIDLSDFTRLDNFERRDVGRLSPREVINLLEDAFQSGDLADKLGARIAVKSDGVPFFIFEMIRGLKEGQFIRQTEDGTYVQTQIISEIEVPSAVKDLIEHRLRDLTQEQRALLDVGAVHGMTFDPGLVAAVLDRGIVNALQDFAEIERRSGLVRGDGEHLRFDQNQLQEVIYSKLLPRLRREYHTLLADAYAEDEGDDPVFLAHHYLHGSKTKKALPHLEPALEQLEKSYRNEALLDLAGRALGAKGLLAGNERVEVLLKQAGRLHLLGRRDEQRAAIDEAVTVADETGDGVLCGKARQALGELMYALSEYDAARQSFQEALELAEAAGDQKLEASATGRLGGAFRSLGRFAEAQKHYERARALGREIGDRRVEAACTGNLGNVFSSLGRYAEAQEHFERSGALAREIGGRQIEAASTGNLGNVFSALGRYGEAQEHNEKQRALSREIGDRHGEVNAVCCLGLNRVRLGRLDEAREHLDRCRTLCRDIGSRYVEGYALHGLADIAETKGDAASAARLYKEALTLRRELGEEGTVAETLIALGSLEADPAHLDDALAIARENESPGTILSALVERARLPNGDVEAAVAAAKAYEGELEAGTHFRLWQLTSDTKYLEAAKRRLDYLVEHAPEEDRDSMIENVPLHKEIRDAR